MKLIEILKKDMDNMENVLQRTAQRTDIWQDRAVYNIALAVYHIIGYILRKDTRSE